MEIFATNSNTSKVEKNQCLHLFIDFVRQDYKSYSSKYSKPEYVVLLSEKQAILFKDLEDIARIDLEDNIKLSIDGKVLKFTVSNDTNGADEYTIGFLTSTKAKKFSLDLSEDVYDIDDEDLIDELYNRSGVKVTPRKCKVETQDEFLDLITD